MASTARGATSSAKSYHKAGAASAVAHAIVAARASGATAGNPFTPARVPITGQLWPRGKSG